MQYKFRSKLWRYPGHAGWHFITLPGDVADGIRRLSPSRSAYGSMKVVARIARTTWKTSLFPDSRSASLLLPVKAEVRRAEGLSADDLVDVRVTLDT